MKSQNRKFFMGTSSSFRVTTKMPRGLKTKGTALLPPANKPPAFIPCSVYTCPCSQASLLPPKWSSPPSPGAEHWAASPCRLSSKATSRTSARSRRGPGSPAASVRNSPFFWKAGVGPLIPEPPKDLMVHTQAYEQPSTGRGCCWPHTAWVTPGTRTSPTSVFAEGSKSKGNGQVPRDLWAGRGCQVHHQSSIHPTPRSWPQGPLRVPQEPSHSRSVLPREGGWAGSRQTTGGGPQLLQGREQRRIFQNCLGR